jgi:hypothetical protein
MRRGRIAANIAKLPELLRRGMKAETPNQVIPRRAARRTEAAFELLFGSGAAPPSALATPRMIARRFPPPWSVEEQSACFYRARPQRAAGPTLEVTGWGRKSPPRTKSNFLGAIAARSENFESVKAHSVVCQAT